MPSPRYTVRLPHALDALVQARVRAGTPFAVLMREALSAYLADTPPTAALTAADTPLTTGVPIPADSADTGRNLQEQVAALTRRVEALEHALTPRRQAADRDADPGADRPADTLDEHADSSPTGADTRRGTYDPAAAVARMRTLQAEGYSLAQIAAQLTREGLRTRHGKAWHKGTVGYLLQTHGR